MNKPHQKLTYIYYFISHINENYFLKAYVFAL